MYDGDIVMITDNNVLLRNHVELPALMCAQRKAEKKVPTQEDFIKSNIDSFGNSIGQTTNWVTSMFEVRSRFEPDSKEYEVLSYRIDCGELYQQNEIDKAKGIVCKPMPRDWVDRHAVNRIEDEEKKFFYRRIVAQKKPYFMRYIYPALMKDYNKYQKNTNINCLREFGITVSELQSMNHNDMTDRQKEFIHYYDMYLPVGVGNCVMNKICRLFENEFDGYIRKHNATKEFDYRIMRSDTEYDNNHYYKIKKLYEDYNKRLVSYKIYVSHERMDRYDAQALFYTIDEEFKEECIKICPDRKALCNIVLDICYKKKSTRRFAWNMCGDEIIENLLNNTGRTITYPTLNPDGDIHYCGNTFSLETKQLEVDEDNYIERQDVCGEDA